MIFAFPGSLLKRGRWDSLYETSLRKLIILFLIGSCYSLGLRDNHPCIEDSMKNYCPVCYEVPTFQMCISLAVLVITRNAIFWHLLYLLIVSFWLGWSHNSYEMRTHNACRVLQSNASARSVKFHSFTSFFLFFSSSFFFVWLTVYPQHSMREIAVCCL